MNRVARYTYVLEGITIVGAGVMTAIHALLWLGAKPINNLLLSVGYHENTLVSLSIIDRTITMPLGHRVLGFIADGIMLAIALAGVVCFVQLLRRLRAGEYFSPAVMAALKRLSMLALAWVIYNPIRYMLLSVITSWHLGSGNRVLSLAIGSTDLINIVIFGCFVVVTSLIQEGYALRQERDLTI